MADSIPTSRQDYRRLPAWLLADLRSDHAGETGAVYIYRGILALTRDANVRRFAASHLKTEEQHLLLISDLLPANEQSSLLSFWRLAGFLTGALPSMFGSSAVYATIYAVENFVDHHYQEQIDRLTAENESLEIARLLEKCRQDEVAHRDEAGHFISSKPGVILRAWCWLVGCGSATAVAMARWC